MKKLPILLTLTVSLLAANSLARQPQEPPTQVVYRFDDHRYLELKGWDCEGALWYIDTQRGIRSEPVSQFYRIFTQKFVHPSERYIALTGWGQEDSEFQKTTEKHGSLHNFPPVKMNRTVTIMPRAKMLFLSPWSTIRVSYRQNTACICLQSPLMIRALSLADQE